MSDENIKPSIEDVESNKVDASDDSDGAKSSAIDTAVSKENVTESTRYKRDRGDDDKPIADASTEEEQKNDKTDIKNDKEGADASSSTSVADSSAGVEEDSSKSEKEATTAEGENPSKILKSSFLQSSGSAMRETANSSSSWITSSSSTMTAAPSWIASSSSSTANDGNDGNEKSIFGSSSTSTFSGFGGFPSSSSSSTPASFGAFASSFGLASSFGSTLAPAAPFGASATSTSSSQTEIKNGSKKGSKITAGESNEDAGSEENDSEGSENGDDKSDSGEETDDKSTKLNEQGKSQHITGEEGEENILQVKCKIFRLIKEEKRWQEVGVGHLRVNMSKKINTETGEIEGTRIRVIMRREGVYKLLLNGFLLPDTPVELNGDKMLRFTIESHSDDFKGIGSYLMKFFRDSDCSDLHTTLIKLRTMLKNESSST